MLLPTSLRPLIGPLCALKFVYPLRPRSRRLRPAPLRETRMSRRRMFRLTINRSGMGIGITRVGSGIAIATARRDKNLPRWSCFWRRAALLPQCGKWLSLWVGLCGAKLGCVDSSWCLNNKPVTYVRLWCYFALPPSLVCFFDCASPQPEGRVGFDDRY